MTERGSLKRLENESFESPPEFNSASRKKYFAVPAGLRPTLASVTYQSESHRELVYVASEAETKRHQRHLGLRTNAA
jgi:hypothetical protein